MRKCLAFVVTLALAPFSSSPPLSAQGSSPVVTVTVNGTSVTANWTGVAGATSYRVDVGTFAGGTNVVSVNVGNVLSGSGVLGIGTYFIRVYPVAGATVGTPSAEVMFNVGTPRPGAPGNFVASMSGTTLTFTWTAPTSGGAPTTYVISAGSSFNSSNLANVGVGNVLTYSVPAISSLLPTGSYFARLFAVNATGASDPSDEAVFTLGNIPGVPTPNPAAVGGNSVTLSWNAPTGGSAPTNYLIEGQANDYRTLPVAATVNAATTTFSVPSIPNGTYYWRIRAAAGGATGGVYGTASFLVGPIPPVPGGPRTANPGVGRKLPRPSYGSAVVNAVAAAYPFDLRNSCKETGGNNQWLFKLVRELRKYDTRWGLNWKRANRGDMSQDVVAYNWGSLPDEDTIEAYIWDTIGGHCGSNPGPSWIDVTDVTLNSNTLMRWTLQPYAAAGYTP
jgi:hypothetical protein